VSTRRDYKSTATWGQKKNRSQIRRSGLLVGILVLVGVFGSLLAYIRGEYRQIPATPAVSTQQIPAAAKAVVPETLPPAGKPKYDFYTVLPERQVVITKDEMKQRPLRVTQPPKNDSRKQTSRTTTAKTATKTTKSTQSASKAPASKSTTKSASKRYLVQAGAFSKHADADRVKARLALLGIQARIEVGKSNSGKTVHRVRIGPLKNDSQMQALRRRLQQNNIPSIAIALR